MRAATTGTRLLLAVAVTLLAAGCGGDDDGDSTPAKRKIDRSGYFTKEQSESLNPALQVYDTAIKRLDANHDSCSRTANRLFAEGKPGRVAVKCHVDNTTGVVEALDDVDAAFGAIDDTGFRKACASQLADTKEFVAEYRDAWKAVQSDWTAYAADKPVSESKTQQHFSAAYAKGSEFVTTVIGDLTKDCYTKADRTAATTAAEK